MVAKVLIKFIILLLTISDATLIFAETQSIEKKELEIVNSKNLDQINEDFMLSEEDDEKNDISSSEEKNNLSEDFDITKNNKDLSWEKEILDNFFPKATLIALNKVTAKSEKLTIDLKKPVFFGNIQITVHKCWKSSDLYNKENRILISVEENKIDADPEMIFQGWIFSSSPSISSLLHPVYEIIAVDCN